MHGHCIWHGRCLRNKSGLGFSRMAIAIKKPRKGLTSKPMSARQRVYSKSSETPLPQQTRQRPNRAPGNGLLQVMGPTQGLTTRSAGSEYCGNPERHEYELCLAVEDIDHSRTKTKSPQTNGICERFHNGIVHQCIRVCRFEVGTIDLLGLLGPVPQSGNS